jgi:hypothetical protein
MTHRYGMTGTGIFMWICGYRSTQKCPRCGHHCETEAHITLCTSPSTIEQWKILLETLGKDRAKRHTHPGLARFLILRLLEWKIRTPSKALERWNTICRNYRMRKMTLDGKSSCLEIYPYCGKKYRRITFEKYENITQD